MLDRTISPETMERGEQSAMRRIRHNREKADICKRLEGLAGRYLTKRMEPEIKALLPDFETVHVSTSANYGGWITTRIGKMTGQYNDAHEIRLAKGDDRRISAESLRDAREQAEKEIEKDCAALERFRDCAAQWNNLMRYAEELHKTLYAVLWECQEPDAQRVCWR